MGGSLMGTERDHVFVYLISEGFDGPVKVGVSKAPEGRLRDLQIGNARRLSLVEKWRFPDAKTAFEMERFLHDALTDFGPKLSGEWFLLNEDVATSAIGGAAGSWECSEGNGFLTS